MKKKVLQLAGLPAPLMSALQEAYEVVEYSTLSDRDFFRHGGGV